MPDLSDLFREEETRLIEEERRTREAWLEEQTRKDALPENVAKREAFNRALEEGSDETGDDEDAEDDEHENDE